MTIISTQLDTLNDEVTEREEVREFRAQAMGLTDVLLENLNRMDEIKNGGNDFNTIPIETRQVLLRWETAFKDLKAALLADAEIVECYQWRR